MWLINASLQGEHGSKHIHVKEGIIQGITDGSRNENELTLDCKGSIVFPGLINSHDHLDFNLFPRLRNRIYRNYTEWGKDIHQQNKKEIDAVLRIPGNLRMLWGIYKNLLNAVTTVINHGKPAGGSNLITVFEDFCPLHSVGFEQHWKWKLNDPFRKQKPIVMHVGEGTDASSYEEIENLLKWNLWKKKIIGVHGVAMSDQQAKRFMALVWCPDSNYFLLDKTAPVHSLKNHTRILFGTDSTLTGNWNLWEHLRLARKEKSLTDVQLLDALTVSAVETWGLGKKGRILPKYDADIVVAKSMEGLHYWDALYSLNPEDILLILHKGEVCIFDSEIVQEMARQVEMNEFSKIEINRVLKYIKGDLPAIIREIRKYYPGADIPVSFP